MGCLIELCLCRWLHLHSREGEFDDLSIGVPSCNLFLEYLELILHLGIDVALRVGKHPARESVAHLVAIFCDHRFISARGWLSALALLKRTHALMRVLRSTLGATL